MSVELITKEDLEQFKIELFEEIRKLDYNQQSENKSKSWLKGNEVRNLLGISIGTLQNLRLNGTLPYSKIGRLLYYKYEDICKLMEAKNSNGWARNSEIPMLTTGR